MFRQSQFVSSHKPTSYNRSQNRRVPNDGKGNDGQGNEGQGNDGQGNDGQGNEGKGNEGQGNEGQGNEGQGNEGKGNEGKGNEGNEGKGNEGQGNEGQGNEGKGNEGKGNEGKGNEGKGNEGKGNEGKGNEGQEEPHDEAAFSFSNWDELEIPPNLLRGIYAYGYEKPSKIQQSSIKPILAGKDIIAQAQSGTGKTASFAIGTLGIINTDELNKTQAIILAPTRELATQIAGVVAAIGSMMDSLVVGVFVGGSVIEDDIAIIAKKIPTIAVGTPGRIYDLLRRGKINPSTNRIITIDEADEMLSSGFKEQIYNIFQYLPADIQVALFSATLPAHIFDVTKRFMRNPVRIIVNAEQLTLEGLKQYFVTCEDDRSKYATLKELFDWISLNQSIIYCNSVRRVIDLHEAMRNDGFPVCCMHSDMLKSEREQTLKEFRTGKYRVLISSNVTSRGIDVQQVSVVINFDLCKCVHNYLHRIGRGGRWGRKGCGINLITRRDVATLKEIEIHYATQIEEMPAVFDSLM